MKKQTIEQLRQEATKLLKKDEDNLTLRSCWNCNGAHEYMKEWDDVVIMCFECGKYFFKGKDITIYDKKKTKKE